MNKTTCMPTYTVNKEWWGWSYDGNDDYFVDCEEVQRFTDKEEAIKLALNLNRTQFCAWSFLTESRDLTEYVCYSIDCYDPNGEYIETIESRRLGKFKKC